MGFGGGGSLDDLVREQGNITREKLAIYAGAVGDTDTLRVGRSAAQSMEMAFPGAFAQVKLPTGNSHKTLIGAILAQTLSETQAVYPASFEHVLNGKMRFYKSGFVDYLLNKNAGAGFHEHFQFNIVDPVAWPFGVVWWPGVKGAWVYCAAAVFQFPGAKIGDSIIEVLTGAITNDNGYIEHSEEFLGSTWTYIEWEARLYYDVHNATLTQNDYFGLRNTVAGNTGAFFRVGTNALTVACVSRVAAGIETTDNIACDLRNVHKFTIRIKTGQVKFYIDDVLVATHATRIPMTVNIHSYVYLETAEDNPHYIAVDAIAVNLGEAF